MTLTPSEISQAGDKHAEEMPRVMVLEFEPDLTHCVWKDFSHRHRTMAGLLKSLRSEIKAGRYTGYRLITIHKQVYGVES